jgi:hypothetical protein
MRLVAIPEEPFQTGKVIGEDQANLHVTVLLLFCFRRF